MGLGTIPVQTEQKVEEMGVKVGATAADFSPRGPLVALSGNVYMQHLIKCVDVA